MKLYFVSPLARSLEADGQPDAEARSRCDRAVFFAKREPYTVIVLGGGNGALAQKCGVYNLSTSVEIYLQKRYAWQGEILNWGRYNDTDTVDEVLTLHRAVRTHKPSTSPPDTSGEPYKRVARPVTSWWHAPRVWLVCLIIFGKPVRVHVSKTTLVWWKIPLQFVFHECPGFFKSCFHAWRKR